MREPPVVPTADQVLDRVREVWDAEVDAVTHLPVGFGAHHWRASARGSARLFVTFDQLGPRHTLATLRAAYAGAAALAEGGLEFVHAGLPPLAVPLADGALSVTPWVEGVDAERTDRAATAALLRRLHAADPPPGLPSWCPVVGADLAADLAERVAAPWTRGPHGAAARDGVATHLRDLDRWVAAYHRLAESAREHPWVATHGEPGHHNQLSTDTGVLLVDWESLKLAPAERDLRAVGEGDPDLLEMFDLEWRLDEISQYADRFERPHTGTASDRVALRGLLEELERPDRSRPT